MPYKASCAVQDVTLLTHCSVELQSTTSQICRFYVCRMSRCVCVCVWVCPSVLWGLSCVAPTLPSVQRCRVPPGALRLFACGPRKPAGVQHERCNLSTVSHSACRQTENTRQQAVPSTPATYQCTVPADATYIAMQRPVQCNVPASKPNAGSKRRAALESQKRCKCLMVLLRLSMVSGLLLPEQLHSWSRRVWSLV